MRILGMVIALMIGAPVAAQTAQAEYDAARAAYAKGDSAAAIPHFENVLSRMKKAAADPANRQVARIRAEYAGALLSIGRPGDAAANYRMALPALTGTTAEDKQERAIILDGLGVAAESRFEFAEAASAYRESLALQAFPAGDSETVNAWLGLGRTLMFSDHAGARQAMDQALPGAERLFANDKDKLGEVYALRGRIALNDHKLDEARTWLEKALATAGGLTLKVSQSDIRIRGDLAIVAFLRGDKDSARKFLAYTGAGHLEGKQPDTAADMALPTCGDDGLKPNDVAIVEFSVLPGGGTGGISPIYVSRSGIEKPFAEAVASWTWQSDDVAKMPAFWRHGMRLEMRCTGDQHAPDFLMALKPAFDTWAKSIGSPLTSTDGSDAAARVIWLADLDRREKVDGPTSPKLVPLLYKLGINSAVPSTEAVAYLHRASELAKAAGAPADVIALIEIGVASRGSGGRSQNIYKVAAALLQSVAGTLETQGPSSAHALAGVQAYRASALEQARELGAAGALYTAVVATPEASLPKGDPIRLFALLRLASRAAAARQMDNAERYFAETGLSAQQCAIVDVRPIRTATPVSSQDFPSEAMQWGFDGWVKTGYDLDAQGHPVGVRTVLAYPPFIFGPATEKVVARFRYEPLFRGGAAVGCTGREQTVHYRMP